MEFAFGAIFGAIIMLIGIGTGVAFNNKKEDNS